MPRPKSGKAHEVLTVRVPPGLVAEIHDRARLRNMLFRDYVLNALEAYNDQTQFVPLERDARQAISQVRRELQSIDKALRDLGRQAPRTEPMRLGSRAPAESTVDSAPTVPAPESDLIAAMVQEPLFMNGDIPPAPDTPAPGPDFERPEFDETRYRLGKLCPRGHDYLRSGKSLRKKSRAGTCLACDAEQARDRRQQKRQQEVSA
jgi:hypothetical protein